MSNYKICLNCGGSSFVSDRSLGGKIVCVKCGSSSFQKNAYSRISKNKIIYFIIGLLVLFLIIF